MNGKHLTNVVLFITIHLLALVTRSLGSVDNYGYLSQCTKSENPLIITDSVLNERYFMTVQIHYPWYLYRKRFFFGRAIKSIGNDPNIDFKNRKTMVFMDGYMDTSTAPQVRAALGSYARRGYNAISVDAQGLYSLVFPVAARVAREVGNATAVILTGLMKYGLRAADIELVGISLGGQTMSFVAKHFTRISGQKIGRMVGLDPGGPCYRSLGPDYRLSPTDADFVQVIHTGNDGFGMGAAEGHVDFYINGGEYQQILNPYQPWCEDLCGHVLSFAYYFSAVNTYPDKFVGVKCKDVQQARNHACYDNLPRETNVIGMEVDPAKPGIFYVPVGAYPPLYGPSDFIEKRTNYHLEYNDAYSVVDNFLLS